MSVNHTDARTGADPTPLDCDWHWNRHGVSHCAEAARGAVTMFKQVKWNIIFGVFFLVSAILFLFVNRWVDAAWSVLLGFGGLFSAFTQKHPALGRGWLGWTIVIIYILVLAAVFILKLKTP
jgi:hypothetical protein